MTIVLKEILAVSQTVAQGTPTFEGRALLAYGHNRGDHGVVSSREGPASWGFQAETDQMYNAVGFNITSPGSLETGGSAIYNGGAFYATVLGGPSNPDGNLGLDLFDCGELGLTAVGPLNKYLGLFIMGGRTLETKVGYGSFSGTGSLAITGVGFQPDLILMGGAGRMLGGGALAGGAGQQVRLHVLHARVALAGKRRDLYRVAHKVAAPAGGVKALELPRVIAGCVAAGAVAGEVLRLQVDAAALERSL